MNQYWFTLKMMKKKVRYLMERIGEINMATK